MTNGQPYIRYYRPGDPASSTWIPAGQPAPGGHRADREGPSWAAGIVAVLTVLILSAVIIGAAALVGRRMAETGVVRPTPMPTPAVSHG